MKYKHILFDLDGTIAESGEGIIKAVQKGLEKFGIIENDTEKLEVFIGPPLYDTFKKYYNFTDEQYEIALDAFHKYYREKGIFECKIYEGLEELFTEIIEAGGRLYLATSKPEEEAKRVMEHFNLSRYFTFLGGSDGDHNTKRSNKTAVIEYVLEENGLNDKSEIIMVGDRSHDMVGAVNVGIASIGVSYGYGSKKELEEAGASYTVSTVRELRDLLFSLS